MAKANNELTPMRRQYKQIKEENKDCLLFFRLGDFYEMFDEDATIAARELDLTLTTRDRGKPLEEQTPMCGVPYHSVQAYIARLVQKGYRVALCEQLSDPALTKGLVEREVTQIITPGTVTDSSMLEDGRNNYICAICGDGEQYGVAFCDISTGEFHTTVCQHGAAVAAQLGRFSPSEVLRCRASDPLIDETLIRRLHCCLDEMDPDDFDLEKSTETLKSHFGRTVQELGIAPFPAAIRAAGGLLLRLMQLKRSTLAHVRDLHHYSSNSYMELDLDTRRNLELTQTMRSKEKKGSLLGVLDRTCTAMGARMIRAWIENPLLDAAQITQRHAAVAELVDQPILRDELRDSLKYVTDLERVMARISTGAVNARELLAFASGLRALPAVHNSLAGCASNLLARLFHQIDPMQDLAQQIERTITDEPPLTLREGGLIRKGVHPEADRLRDIMNGGTDTIAAIEAAEKEATGIRTLKVSYNRVFGYYIEVSKSFTDQVPLHYIRKQTLANCERYITPQLKELEEQVLTAKDRLNALEYQIFQQLREHLATQIARVQATSIAVAATDTLCSLAEVAAQRNYCCPEMKLDGQISIHDGRHPVVEAMLSDNLFVPNDTHIGTEDHRVSIITGPNMAGKSTYMRQVALIVLMAQMGSFVPARSASIGLVDRVFTRIGASDDLASGKSTFMVEMSEVATILNYASSQSLLILDEIGRGTSTYDGMSIARAVLEHVASKKRIGAKTLFATHYHELSAIEKELPNVKNFNIAVKKRGDQMIFLRKIVPGAAEMSYGIEVAKLAGLPSPVINRARQILQEMESGAIQPHNAVPSMVEPQDQLSMMDMHYQQVCAELERITVETLTPIEAMNALYNLKRMLD